MAPPVEEVELPPEPGAAAVAGADQTQAGAENELQGEAEAPDAWSDVADPLAAEAPAGLEAGTDAPASELTSEATLTSKARTSVSSCEKAGSITATRSMRWPTCSPRAPPTGMREPWRTGLR